VITRRSRFCATRETIDSSSRENILPLGFEGVQTTIARVRAVIAASRVSSRTMKPGGVSVANSGVSPATSAAFRWYP